MAPSYLQLAKNGTAMGLGVATGAVIAGVVVEGLSALGIGIWNYFASDDPPQRRSRSRKGNKGKGKGKRTPTPPA